MKKAIVTFLAAAVAVVPLAGAFGRQMRGPIRGQRVQMRGPVQGKSVSLRGPVQGKRVSQRQPVFRGNSFAQTYNAQSRHSYTRTGSELYDVNRRGFDYYRKNQQWNVNNRWRQYRYDDRVNTNLYRIDR